MHTMSYYYILYYQSQRTHSKPIYFLLGVIGPAPLGQVAVRTIHLSV